MYAITLPILFVVATLGYVVAFVGRRGRHLPGGPTTLPIIGNLHQLPRQRGYLRFAEWAKKYGGMYSIKLASRTAIILTDRRLVKELMDKKSAVSSNRPPAYVMDTMIYEGDDMLVMQPTDVRWRTARKFLHQNFMGSTVEKQHMPLLNAEAVQMLRDMCVEPEEFLEHSKRFANSFVMSVGYGIRTPNAKIQHMVKINQVLGKTTTLLQPGTLPPVDIFPFLKLVPEVLLGNWVSKVMEVRNEMNELYASYLDMVARRRKEEGPRESFADRLIEQQDELGWSWHQLCFMAGLMMEAGSDTTSNTINTFTHLMTKFPEIAKRAQKQIDAVIGEERTPVWADFDTLPIVNAIIKETIRLRPIAPIGFPHALSEDVWLDGKLLPKGSDLIVNAYGLHHDATKFPNPELFDPDHFAGKTALASEYANVADYDARDHYGYGVGRRLCPGIHLAERALFVTISKILWAFDIRPGRDGNGNVVEPNISSETGYQDGVVLGPEPFKCEIRPRSEKRREAIMREFAEAEKEIFPKYQVPKQ